MFPSLHLSIGVRSLDSSIDFFTRVMNAAVTHKDPSGYVNIDFYGCQITLKQSDDDISGLRDLHFGANFDIGAFDALAGNILVSGYPEIVMAPKVVDAGTPMERKKMYLKCPSGYLIELKGYRPAEK